MQVNFGVAGVDVNEVICVNVGGVAGGEDCSERFASCVTLVMTADFPIRRYSSVKAILLFGSM